MRERPPKTNKTGVEALLAMLESALDAVSEGIIITDVDGRIIYYNRALEKMEGLKSSEVVGRYLTEVYRVIPEKSEHMTVVRTGKPVQEQPSSILPAKDGKSAWSPALTPSTRMIRSLALSPSAVISPG